MAKMEDKAKHRCARHGTTFAQGTGHGCSTALSRGRLLHHSDQGSPYASEDYQNMLKDEGITCSMSRRGECYDNAAMESWFSTFKFELGEKFTSCAEAKKESFDYIEVFYNQQRRHSSIGYISPAQAERSYRDRLVLKEAA